MKNFKKLQVALNVYLKEKIKSGEKSLIKQKKFVKKNTISKKKFIIKKKSSLELDCSEFNKISKRIFYEKYKIFSHERFLNKFKDSRQAEINPEYGFYKVYNKSKKKIDRSDLVFFKNIMFPKFKYSKSEIYDSFKKFYKSINIPTSWYYLYEYQVYENAGIFKKKNFNYLAYSKIFNHFKKYEENLKAEYLRKFKTNKIMKKFINNNFSEIFSDIYILVEKIFQDFYSNKTIDKLFIDKYLKKFSSHYKRSDYPSNFKIDEYIDKFDLNYVKNLRLNKKHFKFLVSLVDRAKREYKTVAKDSKKFGLLLLNRNFNFIWNRKKIEKLPLGYFSTYFYNSMLRGYLVRANLLDSTYNLFNEITIYRSRIDYYPGHLFEFKNFFKKIKISKNKAYNRYLNMYKKYCISYKNIRRRSFNNQYTNFVNSFREKTIFQNLALIDLKRSHELYKFNFSKTLNHYLKLNTRYKIFDLFKFNNINDFNYFITLQDLHNKKVSKFKIKSNFFKKNYFSKKKLEWCRWIFKNRRLLSLKKKFKYYCSNTLSYNYKLKFFLTDLIKSVLHEKNSFNLEFSYFKFFNFLLQQNSYKKQNKSFKIYERMRYVNFRKNTQSSDRVLKFEGKFNSLIKILYYTAERNKHEKLHWVKYLKTYRHAPLRFFIEKIVNKYLPDRIKSKFNVPYYYRKESGNIAFNAAKAVAKLMYFSKISIIQMSDKFKIMFLINNIFRKFGLENFSKMYDTYFFNKKINKIFLKKFLIFLKNKILVNREVLGLVTLTTTSFANPFFNMLKRDDLLTIKESLFKYVLLNKNLVNSYVSNKFNFDVCLYIKKFFASFIKNGKKGMVKKIIIKIVHIIKYFNDVNIITFFKLFFYKLQPLIFFKKFHVGKNINNVPFLYNNQIKNNTWDINRRFSTLLISWLIKSIKNRKEKNIFLRIVSEMLDVLKNTGNSIELKKNFYLNFYNSKSYNRLLKFVTWI